MLSMLLIQNFNFIKNLIFLSLPYAMHTHSEDWSIVMWRQDIFLRAKASPIALTLFDISVI